MSDSIEIRSMLEMVIAFRIARDQRQLTHETIDDLAGWPAGYCGKLMAPEPIKNLGWSSLGLGLGALGKKLLMVDDPEQITRVEKRWTPRERPQRTPALVSRVSIEPEAPISQPKNRDSEYMRMIGLKGASKGGKARMKKMTRAQRVKIARKAIVTRWRRQRERERTTA